MNIEFYRIEASVSFLVIFLLIFFIFRTHILRKKYAQLLETSKTLEFSKNQNLPRNRRFKEILFILGISFIALSLMRPRWGEKHTLKKVVGSDLCIALDLSQSMLAEDMRPNRLEYAKRELILLLENLSTTKVTLVGFAGGAFISAPLTSDLEAITDYLSPLNPSYVSFPSTFLQSAITTCTEALGYKDITDSSNEDEKENTAGSILLVTDGDDSNQIDQDIIKGLVKHKIPVHTFLVGKNEGIFIPQKDKDGQISSFIKDPETGAPAKTKAEKDFVSKLAEKTNGHIYVAEDLSNFKLIFSEDIKKRESKLKEEGIETEKEEKFQIPLLFGIIFLLLEWITTEVGGAIPFYLRRFKKNYLKTAIIFFLFPRSSFASSSLNALRNNFGVFLFNQENFSQSQKHFEKALNNESSEKKYLFNWVSSRLKQLEKKQQNSAISDEVETNSVLEEAQEISKILETLTQKEDDPLLKKKWLFQLAQSYELSKKISSAINTYYDALNDPPSKTLDPMTRHNLARLLKQNTDNRGSGNGNQGQGKSGNQGQSNKDKDPNNENKKPQEYKGKSYTPEQVEQIMQSIGSEERKVIKKKSKNEIQKKGNELGKGNGSSKPW